eukprot:CAMPEP_0195509892 /NCGR_PEP_ID=MMETSP0794_2-20130614/2693_1 /TAXON_ID=515487 /ORGANISM="Stephanopyxis turris, Strain CCMP 815" /LENGTH=468 /DNA_ID=CAMNT_0040637211 /DNA_START=136 /DNA_END=1542 /DNA_ORIENTATION=+
MSPQQSKACQCSRKAVRVLLTLTLALLPLELFTSAFSVSASNSQSNNNGSKSSTSNTAMKMSSDGEVDSYSAGRLEEIKQREAELSRLLSAVRQEKLESLRSRPLSIGIIGFGRFGQFLARTFAKHGTKVVVTSRSDYTDIANGMGVSYIPLSDMKSFLNQDLDVIVLAVSIVSFEDTVKSLVTHMNAAKADNNMSQRFQCPLIVDVLSVKEHPRKLLLDYLPVECDVLCTHPMFGPDSAKQGWHGQNFVYERTRVDTVVLNPAFPPVEDGSHHVEKFLDMEGNVHDVHENSDAHVEGMDRIERFLSIWEEEGCNMVPLSCREHDEFAANSQFVTHLMGRVLGAQGLQATPIDTKGFQNVLKLVATTTADSFDLFYGLYKYNPNAVETIMNLRSALDDVVTDLERMEEQDKNAPKWTFYLEKKRTRKQQLHTYDKAELAKFASRGLELNTDRQVKVIPLPNVPQEMRS